MKTIVRAANIGDFKYVFSLLEQLWENKKLYKNMVLKVWKKDRKSSRYASFVSVTGGVISGFAGAAVRDNLWVAGLMCNLNELVVDKNNRGTGIGSLLLGAVERFAVKRKCNGITLESGNFRKEAHGFYKAKGFDARATFFTKLY